MHNGVRAVLYIKGWIEVDPLIKQEKMQFSVLSFVEF